MDLPLLLTLIGLLVTLFGLTLTAYLGREQLALARRKRAQRKLLNFRGDDLVVVFPYLESVPETLVPRTSAEDFAAFTVVLNVLFEMGWRGNLLPITENEVSEPLLQKNLLLICAGRSNPLTNTVIREVESRFQYDMFNFMPIEGSEHWQIKDRFANYFSPSYKQIEDYKEQGLVLRDQLIDDLALIAKVTNPWNPKTKVVILAGIRAIGTWGAAEFLCKEWRQLYRRKNRSGMKKDGDFAAVVSVTYSNARISGQKIEAFKEFS